MYFDRINPILMETSKTSDSSISKFANNVLFEKSDDNYNVANVKFDKDTIMFIKVDGCEIERQYYEF